MRTNKLNVRKFLSSLLDTRTLESTPSYLYHHHIHNNNLSTQCLKSLISNPSFKNNSNYEFPSEPTWNFTSFRDFTTATTTDEKNPDELLRNDAVEDEEVEPIDTWEEEDEAEPEIGDGGDGGGVVLQGCTWGERALSIANEVLQEFGVDMKLYAFKTSPRGYIYVRIDKLLNEYGCPSMEEIESFSRQYKKKLDEAGAMGELPDDLALEVSSPGAERLLKVPDDLQRFKDMPMTVSYTDDLDKKCPVRDGVFFLESVDVESGSCVWKLADVKENKDPSAKGRPLSRKQKDWRLRLPYKMCKKVTLYLDIN